MLVILEQVREVILDVYYPTIDEIIKEVKSTENVGNQIKYLAELTVFVNQIVSAPPEEDWEFETVAALVNRSVEEIKEDLVKEGFIDVI